MVCISICAKLSMICTPFDWKPTQKLQASGFIFGMLDCLLQIKLLTVVIMQTSSLLIFVICDQKEKIPLKSQACTSR